jgi:hypothetical protein
LEGAIDVVCESAVSCEELGENTGMYLFALAVVMLSSSPASFKWFYSGGLRGAWMSWSRILNYLHRGKLSEFSATGKNRESTSNFEST